MIFKRPCRTWGYQGRVRFQPLLPELSPEFFTLSVKIVNNGEIGTYGRIDVLVLTSIHIFATRIRSIILLSTNTEACQLSVEYSPGRAGVC